MTTRILRVSIECEIVDQKYAIVLEDEIEIQNALKDASALSRTLDLVHQIARAKARLQQDQLTLAYREFLIATSIADDVDPNWRAIPDGSHLSSKIPRSILRELQIVRGRVDVMGGGRAEG